MILKIDSGDVWTYYDGITKCDVEQDPTTLYAAKSEGDLDGLHLGNYDARALIVANTPEEWHDAGVDDPALISVRVVQVVAREKVLRIAFDGQAFLCGDDGLTLQRLKVPTMREMVRDRPPGPHPPPPAPAGGMVG